MPKTASQPVEFVAGRPKGQQRLKIASVLFPRAKFTAAQARAWLKKNRFRAGTLEPAGPKSRHLRFRQAAPAEFQKGSFVTLAPGRKVNPRRKKNFFGFGGGGREVVTLDQIRELQKETARSHCNHGDYKAARRVARQSPRKYARDHNLKVEGLLGRAKRKARHAVGRRIERVGRKVKGNPRKPVRGRAGAAGRLGRKAPRSGLLTAAAKKVIARRLGRNPSQGELADAIALYKEFNGKEPGRVVDMEIAAAVPQTYTKLGNLAALAFLPEKDELALGRRLAATDCPDKQAALLQEALRQLTFDADDVTLASDPSGRQLYFLGGNQDIRGLIRQLSPDAHKDYVRLGTCYRIEYVGRKKLDSFETIQYFHDFGEESGVRPTLCFDQINCRLFLAGGKYRVEAPGIID